MNYPTTPPLLKHDLLDLTHFYSDNKDRCGLQNPPLLHTALHPTPPPPLPIADPDKISTLYSYSDSPTPPPSSSLRILAFFSLKSSNYADLTKLTQVATLACKLPVHCDARSRPNTTAFDAFLQWLSNFQLVAVVKLSTGCERFGLITSAGECLAKMHYLNSWSELSPSSLPPSSSSPPPPPTPTLINVSLWTPSEYNSESSQQYAPPGEFTWLPDSCSFYSTPASASSPPPAPASPLWAPSEYTDSNMMSQPVLTSTDDMDVDYSQGASLSALLPPPPGTTTAPLAGGFHANAAAAAADIFYSGLVRSLESSHLSHIYHMRKFNNWIKAKVIANARPKNVNKRGLAVLDLACGKGGDLGKWSLHGLGMRRYCGCDVARGSVKDGAERVLKNRGLMNVKNLSFVVADLGEDVLGGSKQQRLLTWNKGWEDSHQTEFKFVPGGGVPVTERFDVVSVQFAIHYFFSTQTRAERFFKTLGSLLNLGGQVIITTIDARVIVEKIMGSGKVGTAEDLAINVGGQCTLKFSNDCIKRIFDPDASNYGLEYAFQLRDAKEEGGGGDVSEAVDLPEWLCPVDLIAGLAERAGLKLVEHANFHKYYDEKGGGANNPDPLLYNMRVLGVDGKISQDEWDISRLYCMMKFEKVAESSFDKDAKDRKEKAGGGGGVANSPVGGGEITDLQVAMSMSKVKAVLGEEKWAGLSAEEKTAAVKEYISGRPASDI